MERLFIMKLALVTIKWHVHVLVLYVNMPLKEYGILLSVEKKRLETPESTPQVSVIFILVIPSLTKVEEGIWLGKIHGSSIHGWVDGWIDGIGWKIHQSFCRCFVNSLVPGKCGFHLKCVPFKLRFRAWIWYLEHLLWNCLQMNATRPFDDKLPVV